MLTRIVQQSPKLVTFVQEMRLSLTAPQQKHLINFADAIPVTEGKKTIANLQPDLWRCIEQDAMSGRLNQYGSPLPDVGAPFLSGHLAARTGAAKTGDTFRCSGAQELDLHRILPFTRPEQ